MFDKIMLRPLVFDRETFLGQDLSDPIMTIRPGLSQVVEYTYIVNFTMSSASVGVPVIRLKPAKNYSANVLSASQVGFATIRPLFVDV